MPGWGKPEYEMKQAEIPEGDVPTSFDWRDKSKLLKWNIFISKNKLIQVTRIPFFGGEEGGGGVATKDSLWIPPHVFVLGPSLIH